MSSAMMELFVTSFGETLVMVVASGLAASSIGIPLGLALYLAGRGSPLPLLRLPGAVGLALDGLRSVPSIILLVIAIPLVHELFGQAIGLGASIIPLSIIAAPLVARRVETALRGVDRSLLESALTLGARPWQIICRILLPEASAGIAAALGLALASLVGYSAMAGAIGGVGLGDLGIRYGYREFLPEAMLLVVLALVILAEAAHSLGNALAQHLDRR
ncbi:methionine ABC transporter permease [Pollutimonas sp. H1-120]|uniref:methionine ABC transporter permease n=1 Tax=Pollutimonas sp. H1-120 TaxID=3148824 RepID=UPI003B530261